MSTRLRALVIASLGGLCALNASLFLASCGSSGGGSRSSTPYLSLNASPDQLTIYPNTTFNVLVTATTNTSSIPTLAQPQLPSGITTTTTFPVTIPTGGVSISFQTSPTIAPGNYTLTLNGQAGSASATASLSATLQTSAVSFYFVQGQYSEVDVPFGSSGQMQFMTAADGEADYEVALSVSGLPSGTTATVNPQTITPGQSATVTISASSAAPTSQNVVLTLTGTPSAPTASASISFLLDVTPLPGALPDNRTDYFSTEDTPYAAVYDATHSLIFASNSSWNRVDVISSTTHKLVTRIPVREPRGIDITQDNSTVWVATGSRQVFAVNTFSFAVSRYLLPPGSAGYWEGSQLLVLSDGTLMIVLTQGTYSSISGIAIWNPSTNAITFPNPNGGVGTDGFYRSGNGNRVYFIAGDSSGAAFYYDVPTKQFSNVVTLGGYAIGAAVNVDASRVTVCDGNGSNMYDGSLNLIGPLQACGFGFFFGGGSVFSADNLYLYQEVLSGVPVIIKVDAGTLNIVSLAPAMPMIPVMTELSSGYFIPYPFAVDNTGMIFGLEDWGIAFDDAAFAQTYSALQPASPVFLQHMSPYFGPLSGGTTSGDFGNGFSITPAVWYGANRGTASNTEGLAITSPPSTISGPVNVKMLFPDGVEVFDPLFFSYGPYLQYALLSGAPPQGNVSSQVVGYGMPGDDVTGTLTAGGASATLTPPGSNGLQYAGTPFPNKILGYTVPPGTPGWADLTLTTPDGSSTLPKAMFYAQSVTDYASSETFVAVLYDNNRQQLYLSAGDHIDVFSLTSNQFATPLTPPSVQGSSKQFGGLALTPDGSLLLAGDTADASLAAINPDSPSDSYAIAVVPPATNGCNVGPLYVAPTSNNKAFVVTGQLPGGSCEVLGAPYLVDLTSRTAGPPPVSDICTMTYSGFPGYVAASQDGSEVAIGGQIDYGGFCIYDVASNTYTSSPTNQLYGAAFSGDGNVAAAEFVLTDSSSNTIGRVARPDILYSALGGNNSAQPNLREPQLNAAGSLYYMAYANFFDIVDVQRAILRMRFSLSETVSNAAVPMAIDSGGRFIYLLTNKGLTIVDLGEAPLSIGWLNLTSASPGAQITVRGSGFDSSTTATVGGQVATVTLTDQNTLSLTVPNIGPGPAAIVLTNSDGTTYTAVGLLTIQ
jgi:hypothetical protein